MGKQKLIGQPTLNGKPLEMPTSWNDPRFTFAKYLRYMKAGDDRIELLSILTDIDYQTLKTAKIKGIDKLLYCANFVNQAPQFPDKPNKIGKYKLLLDSKGVFDIQFESLAQFEDMRKLMPVLKPEDPERLYKHTEAYATYCALYLQKLRDGEYDGSEALKMIPEVMLMPCSDVISAGGFFFIKLLSLSTGMPLNSRNTTQARKKRTGKASRKPSGHMQRLTKYQGR